MNEKYKELITFLDCALTGKPYEDCLHTFSNSSCKTPEEFYWNKIYYLSDGGYSRLVYGDYECKVLLSNDSTPKVKDAWKRCIELRSDLENLMRETIGDE